MAHTIVAQKMIDSKQIEKIHKILIEDSQDALSYLQDESYLGCGQADAIYFPDSEEQVSILLRHFQDKGTPVSISGAHTGVVGGAVPRGGVIISMERMNRIRGIRKSAKEKTWFIQVEAGVRLQTLQRFIETKILWVWQTLQ